MTAPLLWSLNLADERLFPRQQRQHGHQSECLGRAGDARHGHVAPQCLPGGTAAITARRRRDGLLRRGRRLVLALQPGTYAGATTVTQGNLTPSRGTLGAQAVGASPFRHRRLYRSPPPAPPPTASATRSSRPWPIQRSPRHPPPPSASTPVTRISPSRATSRSIGLKNSGRTRSTSRAALPIWVRSMCTTGNST